MKRKSKIILKQLVKSCMYFLQSTKTFFNVSVGDETMKNFCNSYYLKSLVKHPTCFKNLENPNCIDLILIKHPRSFQNRCVIEARSSDFSGMAVSVWKNHFCELARKVIIYRGFKNFENESFEFPKFSFEWSKDWLH